MARFTQPRRRLGPSRLGVGVARSCPAAQPPDEFGQRLTRAFDERRALGLAVIGQHHDPVRTRRPPGGALDPPDLTVEIAEHGERVGPLRSGVMGHLVVPEQVDVDRRSTFAHVVDDPLHRHVTADHRREGAEEGVRPAAVDTRLDVVAPLETGCPTFASDLDDHREQRPNGLLGTREVAEVAGSEPTLLPSGHAAHRQHGSLGIAGEEVAVARTVVGQQAVAIGVHPFDGRRPFAMVGDDDLTRRLVDPAERRHVDGRSVEDPALADAGLRRPPGLPSGQRVGAVTDPAVQVGRVAGPQGSLEHHIGEPVQLDEDHTWHVGDGRLTGPPPRSAERCVDRTRSRRRWRAGCSPTSSLRQARRRRSTAVQKSSRCTPGSESSTKNTTRASRRMAPRPRVNTEIGTTTNARAGQTTAPTNPTTNPASKASRGRSIENPSSTEARIHSEIAVTTVTTTLRATTRDHDGRSAGRRRTSLPFTFGDRRGSLPARQAHPRGVRRAGGHAGDRADRRRPSPTRSARRGAEPPRLMSRQAQRAVRAPVDRNYQLRANQLRCPRCPLGIEVPGAE